MNDCISARIGIKSSVPLHAQLIVTSYILWKVSNKPYQLTYGEEYNDSDTTKLRFTDEEIAKIIGYIDNKCIEKSDLQENTLVTTQLEALQTAGKNVFKACVFSIVNGSERTAGVRKQKTITYTNVIDLFDAFVSQGEQDFKEFACIVLKHTNVRSSLDFSAQSYSKKFGEFWSFFLNQTKFKDKRDNDHYLVTDVLNLEVEFHENGTARIINKYIKDDLHPAIDKSNQAKNINEIKDYIDRLNCLNNILQPIYCNETPLINELDSQQIEQADYQDTNLHLSVNISGTKIEPIIPKNILFKGVPGTGKSRAIDNILDKYFNLSEELTNSEGAVIPRVLRINIHSGTTNASLMQGIGVQTKDEKILYSEKQGLILTFLFQAIQNPNMPFALVLEEIQENSLNILIGDLIYLIEEAKRTDISKIPNIDKLSGDNIYDLVESICNLDSNNINSVTIPNLIKDDGVKSKKLIFPSNLFVFCTSNYREDKKVIEDNLLRRFEVIEVYPNKEAIHNDSVKLFFEELNASIIEIVDDSHSDRLQIGHAIWINVKDEQSFHRVFLKLIVDFKEIKDFDFDLTIEILERIKGKRLIPFGINYDFENFNSYAELIAHIQSNCGYDFLD